MCSNSEHEGRAVSMLAVNQSTIVMRSLVALNEQSFEMGTYSQWWLTTVTLQ